MASSALKVKNEAPKIARLRFEQIAYLVDSEMEPTGKFAFVLPGPDDFRHLLRRLNFSNEGDEALIYIRTYIHSMPIYMRNVKGRIVTYIGDSQGWHWRYYPTRNLIADINNQYEERAKIFLSNTELQSQEYQQGCEVVTLATMRYCALHGKKFAEELEKTNQALESSVDLKQLNAGLDEYSITKHSGDNVILLAKNQLPQGFVQYLKKFFAIEDPQWGDKVKTIPHDITDRKFVEYQTLTSNITLEADEKSWKKLQEWQHLFLDYYTPDVLANPLYDLSIVHRDDKSILKIRFDPGQIGLSNLMHDNSLLYSDSEYPKAIKLEKLQTIFAELGMQSSVDEKAHTISISANSDDELKSAITQLADLNYQTKLYHSGMHQHFALSQFVFEAKEIVQMEVCKNSKTGGIFLNDVNAALDYFIKLTGNNSIGVLQEGVGIGNNNLVKDVIEQFKMGYKKIVFSCAFQESHQISVIIDRDKKQVICIDSEGELYSEKLENIFKKEDFFKEYTFHDKKPKVLQAKEDEWACGVHVCLNCLDEVGELSENREKAQTDVWLRRIMRASQVAQKQRYAEEEKVITLGKVKNLLNEMYLNPSVNEILSQLVIQVNQNFPLKLPSSFKKLKEHPDFWNSMVSLNEPSKMLLRYIYTLSELEIEKDKIEKMLSDFIVLITSNVANKDYIRKKPSSTKIIKFPLDNEISRLFELELLDKLEKLPGILSQQEWLRHVILSLEGENKFSKLQTIFSSDLLDGIKSMVGVQEDKTDTDIENWITYLFIDQLAKITLTHIEVEEAAQARIKKEKETYLSTTKNNNLELQFEKIKTLVGPDFEARLQVLKTLKNKIFIYTPEGWAEIIKNIDLDEALLQKIMIAYEASSTSYFYISVLKTLKQEKRDAEVVSLFLGNMQDRSEVKPSAMLQKIRESGDENLLDALVFFPRDQQLNFLQTKSPSGQTYLEIINNYLESEVIHAKLPTTIGIIEDYIDFLSPKINKVKLENLPPYFILSLLPALEQTLTKKSKLGDIIKFLPEEYKLEWANQFQKFIKDAKALSNILSQLPNNRFQYVIQILDEVIKNDRADRFIGDQSTHAKTFSATLKELTLNERYMILNNPKYEVFFATGDVIAAVMDVLPKQERLTFLQKHLAKIEDCWVLSEGTKKLPKNMQWNFVGTQEHLIKTAKDILYISPFVPPSEALAFLHRHQAKIHTAMDVINLTDSLPIIYRPDFIYQYENKISDSNDLMIFLSYYPETLQRWDLIARFTNLIQSVSEVATFIVLLPEDYYADLIKSVPNIIFDNKSLVDLLRSRDMTPAINKDLIEQLEKVSSSLVKPANITLFAAMIGLLPKDDRYTFVLRQQYQFADTQEFLSILILLNPKERLPYVEYFLQTDEFKQIAEGFNPSLIKDVLMPDEIEKFEQLIKSQVKPKQSESLYTTQMKSVSIWSERKTIDEKNILPSPKKITPRHDQ